MECQTQRLQDAVAELQERLADMEALFDLRWKADMRAIERWRAEKPDERDLMQPDHADLCIWLAEENARLRKWIALVLSWRDSDFDRDAVRSALRAALGDSR